VHDCGGIHRLTISLSWFESHLVGGRDGGFIQPMTQAADYAIDVQLSVGPKTDFEQNFSLQPELAGLVGINRTWLKSNLHLIGGGPESASCSLAPP